MNDKIDKLTQDKQMIVNSVNKVSSLVLGLLRNIFPLFKVQFSTLDSFGVVNIDVRNIIKS